MKARAIDPFTGDLFGPAVGAPARPARTRSQASPVTAAGAPAAGAPRVAPSPPLAAGPVPVPPAPPLPQTPRAAVLWYAVVFAGLEPAHSAPRLAQLARIALRFTPLVSLEPPNALLLELKGSIRLFGSLARLRVALDAAWRELELEAHGALAPSTLAALWLARSGSQAGIETVPALAAALAPLPLTVTAWEPETLTTLRAMGIQHLGDLLRLPRSGLARRFGAALLRELDVALARAPAPRRRFVPRERFCERRDFESEVETVTGLLEFVVPLIERCARFLCLRQAGVRALELRLRHRERAPSRLRFGLASATSARERLLDTVMHTLSRSELAAPVRSVELRSAALEPLAAASLDVFRISRTGRGRDTAPQLIERLRARLGERSVYGIRTCAEHRPERAWTRTAALEADRPARLAPTRSERSDEPFPRGSRAARPLWLLAEPRALGAQEPPRSERGPLSLEEGPERIESGWWDGMDVERDYYCAREPGGARLWVFKALDSGGWFLHGVFA